MTNQETKAGNVLIARFANRQFSSSSINDHAELPDELARKLKYHSDWNALMGVVEKIEQQGTIVEISLCLGKMCRIIKGSFKTPVITIANVESNSTIEAVFQAVVKYIEWHNAQTKEK